MRKLLADDEKFMRLRARLVDLGAQRGVRDRGGGSLMALVEPLGADHDPEVAELARFFNETLGFPPNSVLTMQRRPEIAKAFINLNRAVMANAGRVTSEQKAPDRLDRQPDRRLPLLPGPHSARGAALWRQRRTHRRSVELPAQRFVYARRRKRRWLSRKPRRARQTPWTRGSRQICARTGATRRSSKFSAWCRCSVI